MHTCGCLGVCLPTPHAFKYQLWILDSCLIGNNYMSTSMPNTTESARLRNGWLLVIPPLEIAPDIAAQNVGKAGNA